MATTFHRGLHWLVDQLDDQEQETDEFVAKRLLADADLNLVEISPFVERSQEGNSSSQRRTSQASVIESPIHDLAAAPPQMLLQFPANNFLPDPLVACSKNTEMGKSPKYATHLRV